MSAQDIRHKGGTAMDKNSSKDFAWQLFKNTGNIDAFMIMKQYEELGTDITPNLGNLGVNDGNSKN